MLNERREMSIFSQKAISDVAEGIKKGRAVRGPFDIQIMPLDYCNLACRFCPIQAVDSQVKEKFAPRFKPEHVRMEWNIFEKIVEGLIALGGAERVHITGGEPLLHPQVDLMIKGLKTRLNVPHVAVVTNGVQLVKKAGVLVKAGVDKVIVSLNSVDPKARAILSPGEHPESIGKICSGLREFNSLRKNRHPALAISSVLTRYNYDEVEAQFEVARKFCAASLTFLPLVPFEYGGIVSNESLVVQEAQFEKFLFELEKVKKKGAEEGIWVGYSGAPDDKGVLKSLNVNKIPCYAGFAFAVFWPNGSVRPCCNCEEVMGNLSSQGLSEIWHGEKYARFRMELLHTPREARGCSCDECGYMYENREIFERISALESSKNLF